jgi:hypothetical protein
MARTPDARAGGRLLLGSAAALLASTAAWAQSAVPSTSLNAGLGTAIPQDTALGSGLVNLRDLVNAPSLNPEGKEVVVSASIGAFAGYTDNLGLTAGGGNSARQQGSFEEHVTPQIGVLADTSRLQGSLNYAPDLRFYNSEGSDNRVAQNLAAQGSATLIEDALFVNASAFATMASASQLSAYNGSRLTTSQAMSQVYGYSFNPYFLHRFGDAASLKASYEFAGSYFDNGVTANSGSRQPNNSSASQTEDVLITSGSDFQTLSHALEGSATQFLGNGSERGGYRNTATYTATYAMTRALALIGMAGVEGVHYAGTSVSGVATSKPYNFNGPIGQGGIRFTPSDDSRLTLMYGSLDGAPAFSADGELHLGSRITLSLTSSTGLSTNSQDLQNVANAATIGPDGTLSQGLGNTPLGYSLGIAGADNLVYRLTRSTAALVWALDRDAFSASVSRNQTQNVNDSTAQGLNTVSILGSLGWQHQFTEALSGSVGGSYGASHTGGGGPSGGTSPTAGATARLSDQLTETLSAEIDYTYTREKAFGLGNAQIGPVQSANEIIAGLVQKF